MTRGCRLSYQTIFIPVGLPCAGKTSLFRQMMEIDDIGDNLMLVSPDEIREEIYPGYDAGLIPFSDIDNTTIFMNSYIRLEDNILDGWDVWFDATNITIGSRLMIHEYAERAADSPEFTGGQLHYVVIDMDVPIEEIRSRNDSCRVGHRRPPSDVIDSLHEYRVANSDLSLPGENSEVWRLRWDGKWKTADRFDPPTVCSDMIASANEANIGKRTRRAP